MTESTKAIVAIDVDDVLAHSTEAFRLAVNEKAGAQLTPEDYRVPGDYHQYYERVWQTHGIADKVPADELFGQMERDQSHVPPYKGASAVLRKLAKQYELIVVTARYPEWYEATDVWLKSHFPDVFSQIHFGGSNRDPLGRSKGDICVEIGAKYLIDDNIEHCTSAADRGVTPILFGEYGWHVGVPQGTIRCKTWNEVEKYFDTA
jgi:5'(3')-deoxyribonucleotidase